MSKNPRENFILSGFICILFGAFFTIDGVYVLASTIGVFGILLFIIGMSLKSNIGLSESEIRNLSPSEENFPDAGRVMYRVDTTIDEPIQTTILCGPCGKITTVDGGRPASFTCGNCSQLLWSTGEEE